jgi:hypothetical protein
VPRVDSSRPVGPVKRYHTCQLCKGRIRRNTRVCQLAVGRWWKGHVTPDYNWRPELLGWWHERCVIDSLQAHHEQEPPYFCEVCGDPAQHGSLILYAAVGRYTRPEFMRPEKRGDTLRLIAHVTCCGTGEREYFLEGKAATPKPRAGIGKETKWPRFIDWVLRRVRL